MTGSSTTHTQSSNPALFHCTHVIVRAPVLGELWSCRASAWSRWPLPHMEVTSVRCSCYPVPVMSNMCGDALQGGSRRSRHCTRLRTFGLGTIAPLIGTHRSRSSDELSILLWAIAHGFKLILIPNDMVHRGRDTCAFVHLLCHSWCPLHECVHLLWLLSD